MGLITRLVGSTESIVKSSVTDEENLAKVWNDYLETVPKKEELINKLPYLFGEKRAQLKKLSGLLKLELVDIKIGEKEEDDLISNIHSLEHSKKINRVASLRDCLGYVATKYEHVYSLVFHIYAVLKLEAHLIEKMKNSDIRDYRKLIEKLKSEIVVEKALIEQIGDIRTFHNLLTNLVNGEKIVARMDMAERKLYKEMSVEMKKIFRNKLKEGILYDLTHRVFNAIEYEVRNVIANSPNIKPDGLSETHGNSHYEFVNRPEFIKLVRRIITLQKLVIITSIPPNEELSKIIEQFINVFVHIFREWYNNEIG